MTLTFRPTRYNLPVQLAQAGPKNSYYLQSEKVQYELRILVKTQVITFTHLFKNFSEGRECCAWAKRRNGPNRLFFWSLTGCLQRCGVLDVRSNSENFLGAGVPLSYLRPRRKVTPRQIHTAILLPRILGLLTQMLSLGTLNPTCSISSFYSYNIGMI